MQFQMWFRNNTNKPQLYSPETRLCASCRHNAAVCSRYSEVGKCCVDFAQLEPPRSAEEVVLWWAAAFGDLLCQRDCFLGWSFWFPGNLQINCSSAVLGSYCTNDPRDRRQIGEIWESVNWRNSEMPRGLLDSSSPCLCGPDGQKMCWCRTTLRNKCFQGLFKD